MIRTQLLKELSSYLEECESLRDLLRQSVGPLLDIERNGPEIAAKRKNLTEKTAQYERFLAKLGKKPASIDPVWRVTYGAYDNAFTNDILQRAGRSLDAVIDDVIS